MKKFTLFNKSYLKYLPTIAIIILIGFCFFFLWQGESNSKQSEASMIAGVVFQGEYKIGDGEWNEIIKGEHIPSTQGDVTLRGTFIMLNPVTGEPLNPVKAGTSVSLYFNRLKAWARLDLMQKMTELERMPAL